MFVCLKNKKSDSRKSDFFLSCEFNCFCIKLQTYHCVVWKTISTSSDIHVKAIEYIVMQICFKNTTDKT